MAHEEEFKKAYNKDVNMADALGCLGGIILRVNVFSRIELNEERLDAALKYCELQISELKNNQYDLQHNILQGKKKAFSKVAKKYMQCFDECKEDVINLLEVFNDLLNKNDGYTKEQFNHLFKSINESKNYKKMNKLESKIREFEMETPLGLQKFYKNVQKEFDETCKRINKERKILYQLINPKSDISE